MTGRFTRWCTHLTSIVKKPGGGLLLLGVLLAGAFACAPHMTVTPTPRVVCSGTTLTLEWKGCGDVVEVTQDPAHVLCSGATPCQVAKKDKRDVRVDREMALTFAAMNGGDPVHSETAKWEVQPVRAGEPNRRIASIDKCDATTKVASGSLDVGDKDWAPSLLIDDVLVMAPADRIVRVLHDGASMERGPKVDPHAPSPFHGKSASGRWTIEVPHAPIEACGHVQLPHSHVEIAFTALCGA